MTLCPRGYKGAGFMPNARELPSWPLPVETVEGLASRLLRLIHETWEEALAYEVSILLGLPIAPTRCSGELLDNVLQDIWLLLFFEP